MGERRKPYLVNGKSIGEFYTEKDALIQDLTFLARQGNLVFRGYSKQDHLLPNIIRDKDLSKHESTFLYEFERYGSLYFVANNAIDFLSYAQHYGLPTRLLDFSYNPFIALSFALYANKGLNYREPEDREYYYIRFCNIDKNIVIRGFPVFKGMRFGTFESNSISNQCNSFIQEFIRYLYKTTDMDMFKDYANALYSYNCETSTDSKNFTHLLQTTVQERRICFMDTNQSNQRIIMQQGLFMLPYNLNPDDHISLLREKSQVIKIHKSLRGELLDYLNTLGYNTFRLMPDLPNVCAAITQRVQDRV
ncbi:MAG: hypothetical protein CVV04_07630 [Firmicutes bacterium HGW-Firmicutes-9]|jgi:hypothetical protein|nr:MAG: hypothetical protein CVV04_07630 [Firmicutes bacterium HGW-Firmicutes-9]